MSNKATIAAEGCSKTLCAQRCLAVQKAKKKNIANTKHHTRAQEWWILNRSINDVIHVYLLSFLKIRF